MIRDGPVNLVCVCVCVGRGGGGEMTTEQFLFCWYNRSAIHFFWACAVQIFFIVISFSEGEGEGG